MDNITHSLLGAALAYAGLNRGLSPAPFAPARGASAQPETLPVSSCRSAITLVSVVAANVIDIDIITTPARLIYLEHHRGYTHTFWGILMLALLLPLPFLKWSRSLRRAPVPWGKKYWYLAFVSLIGTAGHLFLDYTNSYGVRPARPFSQRWIYGDFIAVVDPWIYLILGTAMFWVHSRGLRRSLFWAIGVGLISLLVLWFGRGAPVDPLRVVRVTWFAWIPIAWVLRRRLHPRLAALSQRIAIGSLVLLSAYYIFCWQLHRRALQHLRADVGQRFWHESAPPRLSAVAVAGNPFLWTFYLDTQQFYYSGQFDVFDNRVPSVHIVSKNLKGLPFEKLLQTCSGKVMMRFARYPFVDWKERSDGWVVSIKDLRFSIPRSGFGTALVYFDKEWKEREETRPLCPWSEAF
ncbi:MAG TPA: metal-dependent hydrolase [Acidobacteriota bacterium]|jgi:membrane-bound metal-dependent hydrolase YbcI (DUF457 family)